MPGLPWFKVQADAASHPKVAVLAAELGVPLASARGIALGVWCWAAQYAPDGRLPRRLAPALAAFANPETPAGVVEALIAVGLLDEERGGVLAVHGWCELQSAHAEKAARDRARQAETRRNSAEGRKKARATVPRGSHERPATVAGERERERETETEKIGSGSVQPSTVIPFGVGGAGGKQG